MSAFSGTDCVIFVSTPSRGARSTYSDADQRHQKRTLQRWYMSYGDVQWCWSQCGGSHYKHTLFQQGCIVGVAVVERFECRTHFAELDSTMLHLQYRQHFIGNGTDLVSMRWSRIRSLGVFRKPVKVGSPSVIGSTSSRTVVFLSPTAMHHAAFLHTEVTVDGCSWLSLSAVLQCWSLQGLCSTLPDRSGAPLYVVLVQAAPVLQVLVSGAQKSIVSADLSVHTVNRPALRIASYLGSGMVCFADDQVVTPAVMPEANFDRHMYGYAASIIRGRFFEDAEKLVSKNDGLAWLDTLAVAIDIGLQELKAVRD